MSSRPRELLNQAVRLARGDLADERNLARDVRSGRVTVGEGTYGAPRIRRYPGRERHPDVVIGRYCSIADGVTFVINGAHRTDWTSTYPFRSNTGVGDGFVQGHPRDEAPIRVGNDVWIGNGVTVLGGASIGDGAAVAAGAVVVGEVAPYSVVGGVPARLLRHRFSPEIVEELLRIRWWEAPADVIRANAVLLTQEPDVDRLGQAFGRAGH